MKTIVTLIIVVCSIGLAPASAQERLPGTGDFRITFDMARFYGDSSRVFVELYYGIRENMLTYGLEAGVYTGNVNMRYAVRNDSGIVATKEWHVPHKLADSSELSKGRVLTGLESVALPPGQYYTTLVTYDTNDPARRDSLTVMVTVTSFPKDSEAFSDIELCTSIQASADQQSVFYKNTLEVVPNAGRLYGTGLPIMYYYVEVYNLSSAKSQSPMTIHTAIVDASGKEVLAHDKTKPRLHDASVEIGTMNLSAIKSGTYQFRVTLVDSSSNVTASSSKKFFVYKLGSLPDTIAGGPGGFISSEYAFMSQEDLDKEFDYARYISTERERTQYEMLNEVKAKQQFMFEFWERRNPHPGNEGENSYKKEYLNRIEIANRDFGSGIREGWKTDRGRVYIRYGPYDEIERTQSTAESNPYETWHYNSIQGGVIFVFVDRNALGDYILVHSTHRNELQDENWYQEYALKAH